MSKYGRYVFAGQNFRSSFKLNLSPRELENPYGDHLNYHPLSSLPRSFVSHFHFLDTAVYNLAVPFPSIEDAFDEVWKTWYPRRSLAARMNGGTRGFFSRTLKPKRDCGKVDVRDIVSFHEDLVKTVDEHEETQGSDRSAEDSFRKVFIAMDKREWEHEGVLVFCREESVAEFGLREYAPGDIGNGEEEMVLGGGWVAFRKGIVEAVKHIISDPERKKAEAPVLKEYMEKMLQDGY